MEVRKGVTVYHPRYLVIPKIGSDLFIFEQGSGSDIISSSFSFEEDRIDISDYNIAISRLRTTYEYISGNMEENGMPLYAQHVDPVDTATLVDIFRDDPNSCLLGTDAVRDGVDVPGDSLRLIVFDRVPWPRPTILHRARRNAFGGRHYDEMLTRLKLAQAFGRLVRRANDRGIFVMLDGQTPTRLMEAMPEGVDIERLGLAEAVQTIRQFFTESAL